MSEYTQEERLANFRVGFASVENRGPSWWGKVDGVSHFDGPVPQYAIDELIGFDPIQVPMSFVHPISGTTETVNINMTGMDRDSKRSPMVVLRSDTMAPLGFNGGGSKLFGYRQWFIDGPAVILDESKNALQVGFVGLFKGGASAALQLELADTLTDDKTGVAFRPFLYAATSLDGSLLSQYGRGYTRIVCDNTSRAAQGEAKRSGLWYGLRQTSNARMDVSAARQGLQIFDGMPDEVTAELHRMCDTEVTSAQWAAFLDAWNPIPEKDATVKSGGRAYTTAVKTREELDHLWAFDNRVAPWAGTAFGVSQAVTTWAQHFQVVRNVSRNERNKLNMIAGDDAKVEVKALALLEGILANA